MNSDTPTPSQGMNGEVGQNDEIPVAAQDIDATFLPLIHDIVKIIEKDPQDASAKNNESLEAAKKVLELNKKFETVRESVKKLPGVDFTADEQQANLRALKKQLVLKRQLIQKYKEVGDSQAFFNLRDQAGLALNGMDTS